MAPPAGLFDQPYRFSFEQCWHVVTEENRTLIFCYGLCVNILIALPHTMKQTEQSDFRDAELFLWKAFFCQALACRTPSPLYTCAAF